VAVEVAAVVAVAEFRDRVGLGWRSEIAAHIMTHLEYIDILEVVADNYFSASTKSIQSLQFLAKQIPVLLHGVSMGLASSEVVATAQVEKMARLVDKVNPESWSEHMAFVRAGGIEIGHLAAPPRNLQTLECALNNISKATNIVGSAPHLENIATLVQPPASTLSESKWVTDIIQNSNSYLLLDLHNLYANAINFGINPEAMLLQFPLQRVTTVHISGGCWIKTPDRKGQRLLDDHVHDVPVEVFDLLMLVARYSQQNLTVLLERDGNFPSFKHLLAQLESARHALRNGRRMALKGDAVVFA
jgi:uncharacterized protein